MTNLRNENRELEIAQNIADDFSTNYVDPLGNEIHSIIFFEKPSYSKDFTGNVTFKFYINDNTEWKVGAVVKENSKEAWAYGSDFIELERSDEKLTKKEVTVLFWEDN